MNQGVIIKVVGPLVKASGMSQAKMFEVVRVSDKKLVGEVIELSGDTASIQVYEDTAGVGPGEPVYLTGEVMTVELGPGLLETMYDGIQRPLKAIETVSSSVFIDRGIDVPGLNREKKWSFTATVRSGTKVTGGQIIGTVQETTLIEHKIMVPPMLSGVIRSIEPSGSFTVTETIAVLETENGDVPLTLMQKWPIRKPRPIVSKQIPSVPLVTGGRSIDTFFPIVKGAAACIPGPFGAGKTVTQQTLAKYCDAQVIVYVGCGERGNEMTEVLIEFPHLKDPNTGEPLMKRTIMIANTSNMPVAAREASVYTGITIAEYYRDMGYHVAMMADSTSRWAEAMREMSGRLEEMPGEEGYPAYLGSRIAQFYERAGAVQCYGDKTREGSLTVIGAVSPPGGDLSEPVTQNTLRVTKTYWGLDSKLAYKRHFPAINWLSSYSLYVENLTEWWKKNIAEDMPEIRSKALDILQEEAKLEEIVRLVGMEALSSKERLVMLTAKSLREDFLFQNSFDPEDAYMTPKRTYFILKTIMTLYFTALPLLEENPDFDFKKLENHPILQDIAKAKTVKVDDLENLSALQERISKELRLLV
jgi:V/A-type H+-transporting ATPase subunit A